METPGGRILHFLSVLAVLLVILGYKTVSGVVHFEKSFVLNGKGSEKQDLNCVVYF